VHERPSRLLAAAARSVHCTAASPQWISSGLLVDWGGTGGGRCYDGRLVLAEQVLASRLALAVRICSQATRRDAASIRSWISSERASASDAGVGSVCIAGGGATLVDAALPRKPSVSQMTGNNIMFAIMHAATAKKQAVQERH
jgi:hypothetical protein